MIRILDIAIALLSLIVLLPFLLVVVLVMVAMQGFPVIFSQVRSGKNFRTFRIYKFRTMKRYSEDELAVTQGASDERITRLGLFLRKYKIDEIPQLLNILKGEMSVVGPRPQVPYYTQKFHEFYKEILRAKPGLLSPSAIRYLNEDELLSGIEDPVSYYEDTLIPIKCNMDIDFVRNLDLRRYRQTIFDYFRKVFHV